MKNKFSTIILILLLLPLVSALSLQGNLLGTIIYEPGKYIENLYHVSGTDKDYVVELNVEEELQEFIKLVEEENDGYRLEIDFPDYYIPVGRYSFSIKAKEVAPPDSAMGSTVEVSKLFFVEVYSYDKEILTKLSAENVNLNQPVDFNVHVESRTYSDIENVKAVVTIFDQDNQSITTLQTTQERLPKLTSTNLQTTFDTAGLKAGVYNAQAVVNYDGKEKIAETSFRLGSMNLILKDYSKELTQGFSDFSVVVENDWGENVKNVYAKLFVEGQQMLQTPTLDIIEPWQEAKLQGITKVDLPLGEYQGMIKLFFQDKQKEEKIMIKVVEAKEKNSDLEDKLAKEKKTQGATVMLILTISLVVILIVSLGWLFFHKGRKQDDF